MHFQIALLPLNIYTGQHGEPVWAAVVQAQELSLIASDPCMAEHLSYSCQPDNHRPPGASCEGVYDHHFLDIRSLNITLNCGTPLAPSQPDSMFCSKKYPHFKKCPFFYSFHSIFKICKLECFIHPIFPVGSRRWGGRVFGQVGSRGFPQPVGEGLTALDGCSGRTM